MVTGLSAWRSSCPSRPSTDSPSTEASWTPSAAESPWPACAARRGRWPRTSCAPAPARSASHHARTLARLDLPTHDVQPVVVVPGPPAHAARVRRILGDRVTVVSSGGAQAHLAAGPHRTLLLHHSGIMLIDAAGVVRYRLATALPTGSFDGPTLQAATDRL